MKGKERAGITFVIMKVSSTLNRDTKQFGKKFLFDGREETCWNSDQVGMTFERFLDHLLMQTCLQGSPQWVSLEFEHPVTVSALCLQFQGMQSFQVIMQKQIKLDTLPRSLP